MRLLKGLGMSGECSAAWDHQEDKFRDVIETG